MFDQIKPTLNVSHSRQGHSLGDHDVITFLNLGNDQCFI